MKEKVLKSNSIKKSIKFKHMENLKKLEKYRGQEISQALFINREWNDLYHNAAFERMQQMGLEDNEDNFIKACYKIDAEFELTFEPDLSYNN